MSYQYHSLKHTPGYPQPAAYDRCRRCLSWSRIRDSPRHVVAPPAPTGAKKDAWERGWSGVFSEKRAFSKEHHFFWGGKACCGFYCLDGRNPTWDVFIPCIDSGRLWTPFQLVSWISESSEVCPKHFSKNYSHIYWHVWWNFESTLCESAYLFHLNIPCRIRKQWSYQNCEAPSCPS